MTFAQYLRATLRRQAAPSAVLAPYLSGMDFFIRQENIQGDMDCLREALGIGKPIPIRQRNVTGAMKDGESYRDFYDDELKALVYKWNAPSFDMFPEYSFEGFEPAGITA